MLLGTRIEWLRAMVGKVRSTRSRRAARSPWATIVVVVACQSEATPADATTDASTSVDAETSTATTSATTSAETADASTSGAATSTSSVSSTESTGEESTTGTIDMPPPAGRRWVLRDVDGAAMDAVVEPTCRSDPSDCVTPEIGHTGPISPQCVRILILGEQYVDLSYDTQTGRAEDCTPHPVTEVFLGAYPTADCAMPGYGAPGEGMLTALEWRRLQRALEDGTVLYESRDAPHLDIGPAYGWTTPELCEPNFMLGGVGLAPWLEAPPWATDALPNPPYTLSWE